MVVVAAGYPKLGRTQNRFLETDYHGSHGVCSRAGFNRELRTEQYSLSESL